MYVGRDPESCLRFLTTSSVDRITMRYLPNRLLSISVSLFSDLEKIAVSFFVMVESGIFSLSFVRDIKHIGLKANHTNPSMLKK